MSRPDSPPGELNPFPPTTGHLTQEGKRRWNPPPASGSHSRARPFPAASRPAQATSIRAASKPRIARAHPGALEIAISHRPSCMVLAAIPAATTRLPSAGKAPSLTRVSSALPIQKIPPTPVHVGPMPLLSHTGSRPQCRSQSRSRYINPLTEAPQATVPGNGFTGHPTQKGEQVGTQYRTSAAGPEPARFPEAHAGRGP
jgi:hypothetical protein